MGIDHGGTHVLVSQEFLHRTDIVSVLQQMGGKTMSQGVTAATFGDACVLERLFHGSLQHCFRHMVSAFNPRTQVQGGMVRGNEFCLDTAI